MTVRKGTVALMGSGELTSTMVQVHKDLLAHLGPSTTAVFLDTPAGFELNADQISDRVRAFFERRVLHDLTVVSYRSRETLSEYDTAKAFRLLERADYILMGPGSPTYALRQWKDTPLPGILLQRVLGGGCLTAASAAALTVGRSTLPVYEIYKVGDDPFWAEGLDILGDLGFPLVVVPHWNNAEGGTFDTRFCFMGEPRFRKLQNLLPEGLGILGIDEHTACILDLERDEARVRGIGSVTLRQGGSDTVFHKGDRFSLRLLREGIRAEGPGVPDRGGPCPTADMGREEGPLSLWDRIHEMERTFHGSLEHGDPKQAANTLLELDRVVWEAQQDLEATEMISQAREVFRESIVQFGMQMESSGRTPGECMAPLVEELLKWRKALRHGRNWQAADALREILHKAGVLVEDTPEGVRWSLKGP